MADKELILDRYEVEGIAGAGGFGTVRIAWDPRIQRKVAIKTIQLTEQDAYRASLPGAEAVAKDHKSDASGTALSPNEARTARIEEGRDEYDYPFGFVPSNPVAERTKADGRWRGVTPWRDYLQEDDRQAGRNSTLLDLPEVLQTPETFVLMDEYNDYDEYGATENMPDGGCADADQPGGYDGWGGNTLVDPAARTPPPADSRDSHNGERITALAHLPGLDEARTAAKLSDSRIVTVYDFEVRDRTAYLIMEYIEGITLTDLLADYGDLLTLDMTAQLFDAVSGALTVAHKAGVLHLDIKPDNIIINRDGQAKVADFGLATLLDASGSGTTGGGTIGYMPLEQMRREDLDARTDEWALGAMTYEMLTGENPFRARSLAEAEQAILEAELILPSLCWDNLDEQVDDVVFYALDPDREERYANVSDFAEEMDKFLGDPEKGKGELALVVADALQEHPEPVAYHSEEKPARGGFLGWLPLAVAQIGDGDADRRDPLEPRRRHGEGAHSEYLGLNPAATRALPKSKSGLEERLGAYLQDYEAKEAEYLQQQVWDEVEEDDDDEEVEGRIPWVDRVPARIAAVAGRVFGAAGTGAVGALAIGNIPLVSIFAGNMTPLVMLVVGAVLAGLSFWKLAHAALAAFVLLAIAILWCGHPIVALVLAVGAGLWFYIAGRETTADVDTVLLEPLAGAVGLAPVVPFVAGISLRPVQAGVCTAFAAIVACVLGSLGTSSLLGWDAFSYWSFADADITRTFARIITRPLTWTMLAGWVVAAVGLSIFSMTGKRWGLIVGLVVACAAMLIGTLVFTPPTPEFFLVIIAAVGVICLLYL